MRSSTIQLLRFKFSFLLLPVFLFSLAMVQHINWLGALVIFLLLHGLLYPASNGYNSYMDRDEDSIGGVEKPMQPTRQLFNITVWMDIAGTLLAFIIGPVFACLYVVYIIFSRLYSYRGVRLKQYPFLGYLTVVLNQGALIFYMVYLGVNALPGFYAPWQGMVICTLLIGAFYPISQVYQHEQDKRDGVITISYRLGITGTFVYCGILYTVAFGLLAFYLNSLGHLTWFLILQAWFLPVIIRFLWWAWQCSKNSKMANFANTMYMNWLAATCTNLAFLTLIILSNIG